MLQASVRSPLSLPVFPRVNVEIGEIELSFDGKLSGEINLLIEFAATTYTELNRTIQRSFIVLNSKMEYFQICTDVITEDYLGKTILEVLSKKGEYLTYDKEKGIRIERIK
ncbi:MAG: hypothetical protein DRN04_10875 [Thermoprotei archaeon]|nr:MAG: hypothetical protein DRN04_10875 [Thermoprotei archaeon]